MSNAAYRRGILNQLEAIWEQYPERTLVSLVHETSERMMGIQWAPDNQWISAMQGIFPDRGHREEKENDGRNRSE